jgi:hypothetical protein
MDSVLCSFCWLKRSKVTNSVAALKKQKQKKTTVTFQDKKRTKTEQLCIQATLSLRLLFVNAEFAWHTLLFIRHVSLFYFCGFPFYFTLMIKLYGIPLVICGPLKPYS